MNQLRKGIYPIVFSLIAISFILQSQTQKVRYLTRVGCIDLQKLVESISRNPKLCKILSLDTDSISQIQQIQVSLAEKNQLIQKSQPRSAETEKMQQEINELQERLNSLHGNFGQNSSSYYRSYLSDAAYINIFKEIKNLALSQGFSLILEKDASVLYMEEDVDLTDQIIKKMQFLVK